jgi:hypothetical protein
MPSRSSPGVGGDAGGHVADEGFGEVAGARFGGGVVLDEEVEDGGVGDVGGEFGDRGEAAAGVAFQGFQAGEVGGLGGPGFVGGGVVGVAGGEGVGGWR